MKRIIALLAPVALIAPLLAGAQDAVPVRPGQSYTPVLGFDPDSAPPFDMLERARGPQSQHQVRIESRVVIRVSPASSVRRSEMLAELPRRPMNTRFEEIDYGNCVDAESILGVQPTNDNRLLFFTDNSMILAARLEDGCSARAYYAGFFVERNEDERLCVSRDRLQSRAGGSCQIADFSRLVAVAN